MFESISHVEVAPVYCGACLWAAMRGERSPDPSGSELIADDPNGLSGYARCAVCGAVEFIPLAAQEIPGYGIDLMHSIDHTRGPDPILMQVVVR